MLRAIAIVLSAVSLGAEEPVHRLPVLSSLYPQGARPGETLRIEVLGEHLDRVSALYFTHPSVTARVLAGEPTRLEIEVSSRSGAPAGPHYLRAISPRGASNAALFRLGVQPHRTESEPNSSLDEAERVETPVTINARLNNDGDFDFFRFRASKGETLVFDLRSARNGSGLDASMVLVDAHNRKLEHDEDTFIWDPFFTHTFRESGEFTVIVQPTHPRNDPGFNYQLDIRRAPHLQTMSPVGLRPGADMEVILFGAALLDTAAPLRFSSPGFSGALVEARGGRARARIKVPAEAALGEHWLRVDSHGLSNDLRFVVETAPVYSGSGPVSPPMVVNGTAKYRQPERFRFQASKGQTLTFEVRAHRYGSPADATIRLLDMAGKQLANNDDGDFPGVNFNKDSRLSHKFAEAGEYQIEIRNLWQVTGENFPYQLLVREPSPGFLLQPDTDQPFIYPGETKKIKVTAVRRDGHKDGIPLHIDGLPAGMRVQAVSIPAGSNEGEIEITADSNLGPGAHGRISIAGSMRQVRIASGGGEGATFAQMDHGWLVAAEKPQFSLECAATSVNLVRGGTADLKVMIRRRKDFSEPLRLRAQNLPNGVTIESESASGGTGSIRFRASADATLGRAARVAVIGEAGGQQQEAPKISLLVD